MTTLDTSALPQSEVWNGSVGAHWAAHHDRYDAMLAEFDKPLFAAAAIRSTDRVLDIGCGAGATSREAAWLAGRGRVLGVDISAPLIERARADLLPNLWYELADAETYAFQEAGFDVLISRGGVMFFADHRAAFANLARALAPGGRFAFVCPRPVDADSAEARVFGRLAEIDPAAPDPAALAAHRAMASLSRPEQLRAALAGFADVAISAVHATSRYGSDPEDAVDFVLSRRPHTEVPGGTRAAMAEEFAPYAGPLGVRLPSSVWLVTGRRP
ncbi:class I SAM-dependent methyltransferase [Streptomyces indicus]|uniref:Methyltransferase domain-containing protein n=1 Tax=Streptomyces indicus TaxID=417292 RepID=A0A1G8URB4_9ACTN|nr:class I SAM-dependent methyltransferase [Streptomyces indicus]SDJ55510.1 Methyltransferase domain-containing protein [Streptomyces indicus]